MDGQKQNRSKKLVTNIAQDMVQYSIRDKKEDSLMAYLDNKIQDTDREKNKR